MARIETTLTETSLAPGLDFIVRGDSTGKTVSETYAITITNEAYDHNPQRYILDIARALYSNSNNGKLLRQEGYREESEDDNGRRVDFSSNERNLLTLNWLYPVSRFAYELDQMTTTSTLHHRNFMKTKGIHIADSNRLEFLTKTTSTLSGLALGIYGGTYGAIEFGNTFLENTGQPLSIIGALSQGLILTGIAASIGLGGTALGYFGSIVGWNQHHKSRYPLAEDNEALNLLCKAAIGNNAQIFIDDIKIKIKETHKAKD